MFLCVDNPRAAGHFLSSLFEVFKKFKCTCDALAFEMTELPVWVETPFIHPLNWVSDDAIWDTPLCVLSARRGQ